MNALGWDGFMIKIILANKRLNRLRVHILKAYIDHVIQIFNLVKTVFVISI